MTAPSNIRNIVLSPLFWPQILAGLLALVGLGLVLTARNLNDGPAPILLAGVEGAPMRLAAMAGLMIGYVLLTPVLGMVWTSMLAFVLLAVLIKTSHPVARLLPACSSRCFSMPSSPTSPASPFRRASS